MWSFWASLSASDCRDIAGLLMVAVGVAGELLAAFDFSKKLLGIRFNPTGFSPLELRKKCLEISSAALIVVGLGLEVSAWPSHIKEILDLRTDNLKQQTIIEELRTKNDELEAEMQPRTISDENFAKFVGLLRDSPDKHPIWVIFSSQSDETVRFTERVRSMLDETGYGIPPTNELFPADPSWMLPWPSGVQGALMKGILIVPSPPPLIFSPEQAKSIGVILIARESSSKSESVIKALSQINIKAVTWTMKGWNTDQMMLFVRSKPDF
jgi:hypothetical protein